MLSTGEMVGREGCQRGREESDPGSSKSLPVGHFMILNLSHHFNGVPSNLDPCILGLVTSTQMFV